MGNKAWTLDLDWTGKEGFQQAEDEEWFSWISQEVCLHALYLVFNSLTLTSYLSQPAGEVRKFGNLTFLRVYDAGHMVFIFSLTILDYVIRLI